MNISQFIRIRIKSSYLQQLENSLYTVYVHNFLWKYTPHSSQIPQISSSFSQTYTIKTAHTHLASCPLNCTGPRESIRRPPRFFQGHDGKKLVRRENWEPLPVKLDDWKQLDLFWGAYPAFHDLHKSPEVESTNQRAFVHIFQRIMEFL